MQLIDSKSYSSNHLSAFHKSPYHLVIHFDINTNLVQLCPSLYVKCVYTRTTFIEVKHIKHCVKTENYHFDTLVGHWICQPCIR